jgi:uncharacterized membrane protein YcaP (DUF421 family)
VSNGEVMVGGMRKIGTTDRDLERAMRDNGMTPDVSRLAMAYLERDGSIDVVSKSSEAKVLEISVQDGVQTVRIELN